MKNIIYILFFIASTFINAQTKESDCYTFYKGGEKYLKPVKYILYDSLNPNMQRKKDKQKKYFHIMGESFVYEQNYAADTCTINFLKKIKLENPADLHQNAYKYFKKKKQEVERKANNKFQVLYPVTDFYPYFKVYILERTDKNKLIKYEVDWEYSSF
jgi:hypothetical protein